MVDSLINIEGHETLTSSKASLHGEETKPEAPINLLIIDDHPLFRRGMRMILERLGKSTIIFESSSYSEAVCLADHQALDLILLDLKMPGVSGLAALEKLVSRYEIPIVIISGEGEPGTILKSFEYSASGFIPKETSPEVLLAALKLVLAGGAYIPPESLSNNLRPFASNQQGPDFESKAVKLSVRQREVLQLAINGTANKVIAKKLAISEGTVKCHLSLAYKALGVKNRTEAILSLT